MTIEEKKDKVMELIMNIAPNAWEETEHGYKTSLRDIPITLLRMHAGDFTITIGYVTILDSRVNNLAFKVSCYFDDYAKTTEQIFDKIIGTK